jgi:hypothetical protein
MKPAIVLIMLFFFNSGSLFCQEKSVDGSPIRGVVVRGGRPGTNLRVINTIGKYQITFNSNDNLNDGTPLFRSTFISGQILRNDGSPLSETAVEIRHNETGVIDKGMTDSQGNFKIGGVKDCLHTVSVNGQNILKIKIDNSGTSNSSGSQAQKAAALSAIGSIPIVGGVLRKTVPNDSVSSDKK